MYFENLFSSIKNLIGKLHCVDASTQIISDDLIREIIKEKRLNHIAIVPDGDRTWAREKGLCASEGHKKAFIEIAPQLFEKIWTWGIHSGTLSCTSPENLKRKKDEMDLLFFYINSMLKNLLPIAMRMNVKMVHLGRKDHLPNELSKTINEFEKETALFSTHYFNVAIDYGSRDELTRAFQKIYKNGIASSEMITEALISGALDTAQQPYPDPDFVIRAGKVCRLSGFMLWQAAYGELYFPQKNFPEFTIDDLKIAIVEFSKRKRSFGADVS